MVKTFLKIKIFGGHEILNCILSVQKNQFLKILGHQNIQSSTRLYFLVQTFQILFFKKSIFEASEALQKYAGMILKKKRLFY